MAGGRLDLRAPACDVITGLVALPGIGDWTAQYVALRALAQRAEAWRPFRGYAVIHLWSTAAGRRS